MEREKNGRLIEPVALPIAVSIVGAPRKGGVRVDGVTLAVFEIGPRGVRLAIGSDC